MSVNNLLVAYDGSENSKRALEKAKSLAEQNKEIQIHILTAWEVPIDMHNYDVNSTGMHSDIIEAHKANAQVKLDDAVGVMAELKDRCQSKIIQGQPAHTIIQYAEDNNIDLIVIGSRGLSGIKKLFLGSVSHHVVQSSSCAVYIVK